MPTGMSAKMAMTQMKMMRTKHPKLMMDQCRLWGAECIVLQSVKIGLYISDLHNTIMAKQMQ
jgi:hypothetical protein